MDTPKHRARKTREIEMTTHVIDIDNETNTFPLLVNLSPSSYDPAFGQAADASVKGKIIQLIASVRTLMRSMFFLLSISSARRKCKQIHG